MADTVSASSENVTEEITPPSYPSSEIENTSSYETDNNNTIENDEDETVVTFDDDKQDTE